MVTVCESEAEFKELEAKHSTIGVFLTDAEIKIAKDCHLFDDIRVFIRMAENEGMKNIAKKLGFDLEYEDRMLKAELSVDRKDEG